MANLLFYSGIYDKFKSFFVFSFGDSKWEEVTEVCLQKFYVSVEGAFTSKWYVIRDGVNRPMRNGLTRKDSHITLPASKRTKKR